METVESVESIVPHNTDQFYSSIQHKSQEKITKLFISSIIENTSVPGNAIITAENEDHFQQVLCKQNFQKKLLSIFKNKNHIYQSQKHTEHILFTILPWWKTIMLLDQHSDYIPTKIEICSQEFTKLLLIYTLMQPQHPPRMFHEMVNLYIWETDDVLSNIRTDMTKTYIYWFSQYADRQREQWIILHQRKQREAAAEHITTDRLL